MEGADTPRESKRQNAQEPDSAATEEVTESPAGSLQLPPGLSRFLTRPAAVALVVWLVYAVFIGALFAGKHDARDFVDEGSFFVQKGSGSQLIRMDPTYHGYDYIGYDGQFFYYMALDPVGARPYIDTPSYRYTRILYPMLARGLALGQPGLVPYSLIFINWLAAGFGTFMLATWLDRRQLSPWYGLIYGLYPGILISVRYDLSEALAFSLAAAAVLLFDHQQLRWRLAGALVFGAVGLTRESALAIAIPFVLLELNRRAGRVNRYLRNLSSATVLGSLSFGPYVAWKIFLALWLHTLSGTADQAQFVPLPFLGLARVLLKPDNRLGPNESLRAVVVPATVVLCLVLYAFWKRQRPFAMGWLVILEYVVFVAFLSNFAYIDEIASPRVTTGLVIAAILSLPELVALGVGVRTWFLVAAALWLSSLPIYVAPAVLQPFYRLLQHFHVPGLHRAGATIARLPDRL